MELIDELTKNLGVSKAQAEGGVGLLFKQARENLSGADFSKLAKAVPGVDRMITKAPVSEVPPAGSGDTRAGLGDLANLFSGSGDSGGGLGDLLSGLGGGLGSGTGTAGGLGDLLSGSGGGASSGGGLGSLANLAGGFSKLGLNAGMIAQFLPIILSFLQRKGGEGLKGLLGNAFK